MSEHTAPGILSFFNDIYNLEKKKYFEKSHPFQFGLIINNFQKWFQKQTEKKLIGSLGSVLGSPPTNLVTL